MLPEDFFAWLVPSAVDVCKKYKLPASCLMAQGAIESTWGEDAIGDFNLFGRKWGGDGSFLTLPTREWNTDHYIVIDAKFQVYPNLDAACDDWCQLMIWKSEDGSVDYKQYSDKYAIDHDLDSFVRGIASVYATEPSYGESILNTIHANELEQYD